MTTRLEEKRCEKKPYAKPDLNHSVVYEASGRTCCKVTTSVCTSVARNAVGKSNNTDVTS